MYVLDLLKRYNSNTAQATEDVSFEYRLLCSGELYNAAVLTGDWRKSDYTRLLINGPFTLTVCSHPFDDYPQELSLRFQTPSETITKGVGTFTFYPDEEIARDIASILSLLLRRLITVTAKVREIHTRCYEQEPDYHLDNSIDFVNKMSRDYWKRKPATFVYDVKGIHDIIDYNPQPLGIIPQDLHGLIIALASSPYADSLVLAARLYSQALSQIEHEADLAYQSLISCVETIANKALSEYRPEEADMIETKKSVFEMAGQLGIEQKQCRALAIEACSGMQWAKRKFTKFLVDNTGNDLWDKDDLFQVDQLLCPKQSELVSAIRKIYKARSGATHWGKLYPSSIAIGTGPTVPFDAFLDLNLGKKDAPITPIPPVVWFERLVNLAINNFVRRIAISEIHEQNLDENLTAYCGLCCADCIPSHDEFFALVDRLDQMLEELQFDKYAELKSSQQIKEFEDYPKFLSVLNRIKELRCPAPCRQGGGRPNCEVRQCAQSKKLKGCWECKDRRDCTLLDRLRRIHPNLDYHLDLISEMGADQWFEKRSVHYVWQYGTLLATRK